MRIEKSLMDAPPFGIAHSVFALTDSLPSPAQLSTSIDHGMVDVWHFDLDRLTPQTWKSALIPEEFQRAERFVHEKDRNRFLQARFGLRMLLAAYSGHSPCDLSFTFNEHGKPFLPQSYALNFNLSHSDHMAVIAVGRQAAIGIDIERQCPRMDYRSLAKQVFSEEELDAVDTLAGSELQARFLTGWTRKEAYLKALGVGFALDPRSIIVGLSPCTLQFWNGEKQLAFDIRTIETHDDAVISLAVGLAPDEEYKGVQIHKFSADEIMEVSQ